ncbi:hypothetical protein, partial [Phormidium sp. CCY1219]|uniref:hypothetical protein n=1 Tax=Phormidium sp. CCY1219 TaxID=2886104 RepID=UPI002D1EF57B
SFPGSSLQLVPRLQPGNALCEAPPRERQKIHQRRYYTIVVNRRTIPTLPLHGSNNAWNAMPDRDRIPATVTVDRHFF